MSNGRRMRRRLQAEVTREHDTWHATQMGATADQDLDELEEVKRTTHDRLIQQLGTRRRGGVQWRIWTGLERMEALDELSAGDNPENWDELRIFVETNPDGFLVMASAEAVR